MKEFDVDVKPLIKRLELISKKRLTGFLSGEFRSVIRGQGLEFHGYRKYNAAEDDAKNIDWKASLRSRYLVVKELLEERNNNVVFLIDVSSSMSFGSTEKLKNEYVIEMFGALAHVLLAEGDSVGIAMMADRIRKFIEPNIGAKQLYILLKELTNVENYEGDMKFASCLHDFGAMLARPSIILIVSDFLNMEGKWKEELKLIAAKHEVICLGVNDPRDLELPKETGEIIVEDLQTNQHLLIDTKTVKEDYEKTVQKHKKDLQEFFQNNSIDYVFMRTDQPFVKILYTYFKERGLQAMGG